MLCKIPGALLRILVLRRTTVVSWMIPGMCSGPESAGCSLGIIWQSIGMALKRTKQPKASNEGGG